jgi:hypothetical protein
VLEEILSVAVPTDEMRDGWENMPRFVECYPMRFYRDRTANDAPRYEVLPDSSDHWPNAWRIQDTALGYNVGWSADRAGIETRMQELTG